MSNVNKVQALFLAKLERAGIPKAFARTRIRTALWRSLWAVLAEPTCVDAITMELRKMLNEDKVAWDRYFASQGPLAGDAGGAPAASGGREGEALPASAQPKGGCV